MPVGVSEFALEFGRVYIIWGLAAGIDRPNIPNLTHRY